MKLLPLEKISVTDARNIRITILILVLVGFITIEFSSFSLFRKFFPEVFKTDSPCLMYNVTEIPCPLCGMSRSFNEIIRLNFSRAIYYNPSSVIFFTFSGVLCLGIFVLSFFRYKIKFSFNKKTLLIFFLVIVTAWILNIKFGHQ